MINNVSLPVPEACQRSCGRCIPTQRLENINDNNPLIITNTEEQMDTTESTTTSSSTTTITTTTTTTTTSTELNIIFSREEKSI